MNTNSTKISTPMSSREILASKLKNMVSTNKQSIEHVDENSWKFKGVEVDSKTYDYMVRLEAKVGKSGKTFKKRNLYRIVDGTEQKVELGQYKKEYLYKIISGLTTTKAPRAHIEHWNEDEVRKICDYIKNHKNEFTNENGVVTGTIPEFGEIKYTTGYVKAMKNCHKRKFNRKLYVNGEIHSEGGGLHLVDRALVEPKKRGKKKKSETAEK